LTCAPPGKGKNKGPKAAVAAIIAGSIIGAFALCAAIFGLRRGWDSYKALAQEGEGAIKTSGAYKGAGGGGEANLRGSVINQEN
jgi:hypothetical protein